MKSPRTYADDTVTAMERASAAAEKFFATHTPEQVVAKFKESSTGTYLHSDAEIRAAAEARNEVAPSESDEKQARAIGLTLHEPLESREALLGGDYPEPSAAVRAWRARALNLEALLQSALSFLPEKGAGDHWEGCPSLRCEDEHGEDCAIETCPECDCAIGLSVRIRAALENDAAIDVLRELAVDKTAFPTNGEK